MKSRLFIDEIIINIDDIYKRLNSKPISFNYENLRKCKPNNLPTYKYSEQELLKKINDWKNNFKNDEYKVNKNIVILDPNQFTREVKSFDVTILTNYIHHLYNPDDIYLKWNVPRNLLDDFKKYIGAIVFKLFSSDDNFLIEGHLNSLSTAICYCPERQKNEIMFLYEILINEDEKKIEKLQQNEFEFEQGSFEYKKNIKKFIENNIKKFIGSAKLKILMHIFGNPADSQNIHSVNYWKYVLKDHIGLDVFGDKPKYTTKDEFNGRLEFGLHAFFEKFTPEWLIFEFKSFINNDYYLICRIAEFLFYSDNIKEKIKKKFVEYEDEGSDYIFYTNSVTTEFCKFILQEMEIIILN
ncbi:hypothetical protein NAPIS_ORF01554 [Vairimorpha apis BRL 01]|uniref:Uncharacterized protein n=1 Tax=Vairimorpha apis BRL 01 TaxID=1037528 RepID=T0L010_9MICR|nr:hypothetical protein NAPIS_ORF01554 [Vairimorpha apis BRL 01]